jgi:hypothetical protein
MLPVSAFSYFGPGFLRRHRSSVCSARASFVCQQHKVGRVNLAILGRKSDRLQDSKNNF